VAFGFFGAVLIFARFAPEGPALFHEELGAKSRELFERRLKRGLDVSYFTIAGARMTRNQPL